MLGLQVLPPVYSSLLVPLQDSTYIIGLSSGAAQFFPQSSKVFARFMVVPLLTPSGVYCTSVASCVQVTLPSCGGWG